VFDAYQLRAIPHLAGYRPLITIDDRKVDPMNITTLRHDPPEPPAEADTFSFGAVFTVICEQVTGEAIANIAHDGALTYTISMEGCGSLGDLDWQEDPKRLRKIVAVAGALADEREARQVR